MLENFIGHDDDDDVGHTVSCKAYVALSELIVSMRL